jgi:hypothetical protein
MSTKIILIENYLLLIKYQRLNNDIRINKDSVNLDYRI